MPSDDQLSVAFRTRIQPSAVLALDRFAFSNTSTISLSTMVRQVLVAFPVKSSKIQLRAS